MKSKQPSSRPRVDASAFDAEGTAAVGYGGSKASGALATIGSTVGLAFGPSTILVFSFGSFVPALQQEFGWARGEIMIAATLVSLMIVVTSPIQGWLLDRFGTRRIMLPSAAAFGLSLLAYSHLPNSIYAFYAAYIIMPLVGCGLWPVAYLRVVTTWFDRRLGLALGVANSGIGLGAAILPLLAAVIMDRSGWRAVYLCFSFIVFLTLALNAMVLRDNKEMRFDGKAASPASAETSFRDIRRTGQFRALVLAYALLGFVSGIVVNQIPLVIDTGATPAQAAMVQFTYGASVIVGRLLVSALLDVFEASSIMWIACLSAVAAFIIYASMPVVWPAFIAAALLGMVLGAEFDVAAYLVRRSFGIAVFGRAYSFLYTAFQLATAIGISVLAFSQAKMGSYVPGLLLYAVFAAGAALCFKRLGSAASISESIRQRPLPG